MRAMVFAIPVSLRKGLTRKSQIHQEQLEFVV
jgi:hypothetical protein